MSLNEHAIWIYVSIVEYDSINNQDEIKRDLDTIANQWKWIRTKGAEALKKSRSNIWMNCFLIEMCLSNYN